MVGLRCVPRHIQCIDHQLRRHFITDLPTDDTATPNIEDDGKKDKPLPGRHVSHIRYPPLVRCFSDKLAIDEIRRRTFFFIALRGDDVTAAAVGLRGGLGPGPFAHAAPVVAPHDMRNAILASANTMVG